MCQVGLSERENDELFKELRKEKREETLLCLEELSFNMKTGKKEEIKFDRHISQWAATFQITTKLYMCGGSCVISEEEE